MSAVVLLVLGVAGFVPGITADYGAPGITGEGPDARLFGLLPVSPMHNVLLLLFGGALWAAAGRGA